MKKKIRIFTAFLLSVGWLFAGPSQAYASNIIDQCVANIDDPAFSKTALLSIVEKSESDLLA